MTKNVQPVDPQDELFEDEFAGEWPDLEPMDVPGFEHLPTAGIDMIQRLLGIDMTGQNDAITAQRIAANEWFWRRRAGQKVTYRQVWRSASIANTMKKTEDGAPAAADPTTTTTTVSG